MLAALGVILVFLVVTAIIAGTVQKAQMNWMGATQNRVKFIVSSNNQPPEYLDSNVFKDLYHAKYPAHQALIIRASSNSSGDTAARD
jgi:hypothetical protein